MCDGEFEDSVEEQASAARAAAVETEDELVEILIEVIGLDRALVRAEQPSQRLCSAEHNQ